MKISRTWLFIITKGVIHQWVALPILVVSRQMPHVQSSNSLPSFGFGQVKSVLGCTQVWQSLFLGILLIFFWCFDGLASGFLFFLMVWRIRQLGSRSSHPPLRITMQSWAWSKFDSGIGWLFSVIHKKLKSDLQLTKVIGNGNKDDSPYTSHFFLAQFL